MAATIDPYHRISDIIVRHTAAEYTNNIDLIMSTVATRPRYVIMNRGSAKLVLQDAEAVRGYYAGARVKADLLTQYTVKQIVTDWYSCGEAWATYRWHGSVDGVDYDGQEYNIPVAVFLPMGVEDALLSEFVYYPCTPEEALLAAVNNEGAIWDKAAPGPSIFDRHRELVAALQANEPQKLREMFAPNASFVTRDFDDPQARMMVLEGVDAIVDYHATQLTRAPKVSYEVLTHISASWYLFAEQHWTFRDEDGSVLEDQRTAGIYTHDDAGSLLTYFGYGRD